MAPETSDYMANELQVRWECGGIRINAALFDCNPIGVLLPTLLSTWRFKSFTKSRWLTLGPAAHVFLVSKLTGADALVSCINRESNTLWHINGFSRIAVEEMKLLCAVALAARPTDSLVALLMEDSRVPHI